MQVKIENFKFNRLYNCFELEDILQEQGIQFMAKRGVKTKNRLRSREEEKSISSRRQIIETAFSSILHQFPRIH